MIVASPAKTVSLPAEILTSDRRLLMGRPINCSALQVKEALNREKSSSAWEWLWSPRENRMWNVSMQWVSMP